ncbi:hypothetical protein FXO38_12646 [Capsicum annuum]|nr:hypothetical protein FXO38_12646 [Capsicum annuum]
MLSKSSFSSYLLVGPASDVGSFSNSVAEQQILQELPDEAIKSIKEYLRSLISIPGRKDFLFLSSSFPASITIFAKSSLNIMGSSNGRKGMITIDHHQDDAKDVSESDKMIGDECSSIKER